MSSTEADRVNRELQSLAREHHGRNTQALQLLYAIEGFLRRLSLSGYRERLVLKGAMLLAVLDARRTTKDADLSAHGIPNDEASVAGAVAEIAATVLPESDWILFDPASITTERMREGASYPRSAGQAPRDDRGGACRGDPSTSPSATQARWRRSATRRSSVERASCSMPIRSSGPWRRRSRR